MSTKWVSVATLLSLAACTPPRPEPPRPSGAGWLTIVHHHKMGASFRLEKLAYRVDGRPVFEREGAAVDQPTIVSTEILPAGEHDVVVFVRYRGNGYGVFSYLNKYRFDVTSKHTVTVLDRQHVQLDVTAFEKGGATTPLENRPAIAFRANLVDPHAVPR